MKPNSATTSDSHHAAAIGRRQKEKFLQNFSEDDFRDQVVHPLFERKGLRFVRDTCGSDEEGKDCLFQSVDPLGKTIVYAVQTKKGNLNMSSKPRDNVERASTQLKTALNTTVVVGKPSARVKPFRVILCASGTINKAARDHIHKELNDPRVDYLDAEDLIPDIDNLYPELWFGIDADKFPYLRKLKDELLGASDTIPIPDSTRTGVKLAPIADGSYVTLYLTRFTTKPVRRRGQVTREPELEQIPVASVLRAQDRRVLILGEGGSGKTTAVRRLAYELANRALGSEKTEALPVLLKASQIAQCEDRIVEIAQAHTGRVIGTGKSAFSQDDLHSGRVVCLVDALDEVPHDERLKDVLARLETFHEEYPDCFIILTSRDYEFTSRLAALKAYVSYRLIAMDIKQAMRIVERVAEGRSVPKAQASEMLRRLDEVHGMGLNPLLVTVFVATTDFSKRDIPPNITEVFKKFTEMMLGRWDETKGLAQQYEAPLKDFVLKKLAFRMHDNRKRRLSEAECRSLIARELEERGQKRVNIEVLFDELVHRSGLLRQDDDHIEYRHHLLQEFFAGRGVPNARFFGRVLQDDWWRNPIVFYFGDNPEKHDELNTLVEGVEIQPGQALYNSAVTVGLAIQACYLAKVSEKENTLEWVVDKLAATYESFTSFIEKGALRYPLTAFLYYYLLAREAVAAEQIVAVEQQVVANLPPEPTARDELRRFWCIVGLMEAGHLAEAESALRVFTPKDNQLLLAIDLGAMLTAKLRISTADQKKAADRISKRIRPRVEYLVAQTIDEVRGCMLEIREGEIKALDAPPAT